MLGVGRDSKLRTLLSSYIDGQVNDAESRRVEGHLASCDECRHDLETLRATVGLLKELPEVPPARSFTLEAAAPVVRETRIIVWATGFAASMAALLLAALVLSDMFDVIEQTGQVSTAAMAERAVLAPEVAVAAPAAAMVVPAPAAPAPAAPTQSGLPAPVAPASPQTGQPAPAPVAPATEPAATELPVALGVPVPAPTGVEAPAVAPAPPVQVPSSAAFAQAGGVSTQGSSQLLQVASSQAGIWVTGLGTISLEPDLSVVTIGVQTEAATVAEARNEAVKSHGLTDRDVQTRSFNINPVYEYPEVIELGRTTRRQVLVGFRVSNTASIKIRDLDDVGPIIDDVANAGGDATRINGISFTVEDTKPFMTQLREDAVNDALAKAEQFASLTGVSVGGLVFISESGGGAPVALPTVERAFSIAAAAPQTSISGGELELRLSVQVVFNIQ